MTLQYPPSHMQADGTMTVGWMKRFSYMERMFKRIEGIEGDVVECGVGRGDTFAMLAYLAGRENELRTLRGFDSFEGFPDPSPHDASWRDPKGGEWAFEEQVAHSLLDASGVRDAFPGQDIRLTKGFFGETLPKEAPYPIAFLHADGDLYESYKDTLENLWDRVVPGGLVLFDEYKEIKPNPETGVMEEKWPGASRAIDEFFEPLGLIPVIDGETNKYHIVKP